MSILINIYQDWYTYTHNLHTKTHAHANIRTYTYTCVRTHSQTHTHHKNLEVGELDNKNSFSARFDLLITPPVALDHGDAGI